MDEQQQRIAIAEACGWVAVFDEDYMGLTGDDPRTGGRNCIPNYTQDLNAMHEAEKVLTVDQRSDYDMVLMDVIIKQFQIHKGMWIWHATAAQRAEAFLRTIGKWEDGGQGDGE